MTELLRLVGYVAACALVSLLVASFIGARLARMRKHYPVREKPGGSREEASPGSSTAKG